jgi:signal transduction histidine kinase
MEARKMAKSKGAANGSGTGLGVDMAGGPVVDPTKNVLELVGAAVQRLDDLANLRGDYEEKLLNAESRRIGEVIELRADFQEKLSLAESRRIDAIRAVDVGAVAIASERAAQQATVLASQVAQSAETLRALVATTAQTVAASLAAVSGQLTERISALEKSSYVGSGRSAVSDPMLSELVQEMRSVRENNRAAFGVKAGGASMWGYIVGGIGAILGLGSLITLIVHTITK